VGSHLTPLRRRCIRWTLVALASGGFASALAAEDFCNSPEFRAGFVSGSPVEPPSGRAECGLHGPNTRFVRDGDTAIPCLARIVEGRALSLGIKECEGKHLACAAWAISGVTEIGSPRARAYLMMLVGSTEDPVVLEAAINGLGKLRVREARPILRGRLAHASPEMQGKLLMILGSIGDADDLPLMLSVALALPPDSFYYALHGFMALSDPRAAVPLERRVRSFPPSNIRDQVLLRMVEQMGVESNVAQGKSQLALGNTAWAETYFNDAIARGRKSRSPKPRALGEAMRCLGELRRQQGRLAEADTLLEGALKIKSGLNASGDELEVMISRALVRDAKNYDRETAEMFHGIAAGMPNVWPESRRIEIEAEFPELGHAVHRYLEYCQQNNLPVCAERLRRFHAELVSRTQEGPLNR
jgi:hypothetical protein